MQIDRCVCKDISFVELKTIQDQQGLDFEALTTQTGAGRQCGMCQPYLAWMVEQGITQFRNLVTQLPPGYSPLTCKKK